jgi:hypothetical protein
MTTNWIVFQDIVKIVAVLEMLSGETMCAGDDATLRQFENLCDHWQKMASAELALRARTK